ncbi:lamin tail domain-containing protein [Haliangium sp.]|uniref:lamin tail domain-containing protein n=1 Tax=Haliangium sp. TaxID=2663208 RepID=UPI003D112237
MLHRRSLHGLITVASAALLFTACGFEPLDGADKALSIPAKGAADTLDIASWNIEHYGNTGLGPDDEDLQRDNVRDVIAGTDFDLWGVEEIRSVSHFEALLSDLPGYDGFLAHDPMVQDGAAFYSGGEQTVGLVFKTDVVSVKSARLILTERNFEFAGRPPLEVNLRVTVGGATEDMVVIVLHAKAIGDLRSWERRLAGAQALKDYLDQNHPTSKVIVIGDFNDDLDTSITRGQPSPYQDFVDDSADYTFPSEALTLAGQSSTINFQDMIDHHLATNELMANFVADSAEVYFVDDLVPNYEDTTSDHRPVLSRYRFGGGGGGVILNEILANEPGSNTAGEFVELVNTGTSSVDLSGWTISDARAVKHTFAAGTVLAAGGAVVVFGSSAGIPAGLDNAVGASASSLSLNNGGDTVTLRDDRGAQIDAFAYTSALSGRDGVSMNRDSDGDGSAEFVLHTALTGAASSPGRRTTGSRF